MDFWEIEVRIKFEYLKFYFLFHVQLQACVGSSRVNSCSKPDAASAFVPNRTPMEPVVIFVCALAARVDFINNVWLKADQLHVLFVGELRPTSSIEEMFASTNVL